MIARILHISDLHFSSQLTERGRQLKKYRVLPGPNSHSFGKVDGLSVSISQSGKTNGPIDLIIATGDVTTDGSTASLTTALEFLQTSGGIYTGRPRRLKTNGLAAGVDMRLVVPGNHDRYGGAYSWPVNQKASDDLEKVFGITQPYPYVVGFRKPAAPNSPNEPALVLFVFDSTLTDEDEESNLLYKIARGRVEDSHCRWLVDTAEQLKKTGKVGGLSGEELMISWDRCLKLAVLHHHPVGRGIDLSFDFNTLREAIDLTKMENAESFVEACVAADVNFILFGHQHLAYRGSVVVNETKKNRWKAVRDVRAVHYFCCPSTSEFKTYNEGDNRNGFYIFSFDERFFSVDTFLWDPELKGFELVNTTTQGYAPPVTQPPLAKRAHN